MRKKAALLLALIMVLSLLPMNLFGSTSEGGLVTRGLALPVATATTAQNITDLQIAFPAEALSGFPILVPHILRIRLIDGNVNAANPGFAQGGRLRVYDATGTLSEAAVSAAVTFGPSNNLATRLNAASDAAAINFADNPGTNDHLGATVTREEMRFLLETDDNAGQDLTLPEMTGFLTVDIGRVQFRGNDAAVIVELFPLANPNAVTVLAGPLPLVAGALVNAVEIEASDDPAEMRAYRLLAADLPDIVISEVDGGFGVIAGTGTPRTSRDNQAVRITLPAGFNFVGFPTITGDVVADVTDPTQVSNANIPNSTTVLVYRFDAQRRAGALATVEPVEIIITGLDLIANVGTTVENVDILVELGWYDADRHNATHRGFNPAPTTASVTWSTTPPDRRGANFQNRVTVATTADRIGNVVGTGPDLEDEDPTRSGAEAANRATGYVRFSETIPGHMLAGHPQFELRITSPGVTFATGGDAPTWGTARPAPAAGTRISTAVPGGRTYFAGSGLFPAGASPTRFVIRPSYSGDLRAGATGLAALEMAYTLNIPAGWVSRTGLTQVRGELLYNGDVIANVVLAEVYDPITVIAPRATQVTMNTVGMLGMHEIPEIVIRETEVGALNTGQLWVQLLVVSGGNVRALDAANRPDFTVGGVSVRTSDLVIPAGAAGRHRANNPADSNTLWGRDGTNPGWVINIASQSTDYPAEIVLTGIEIAGGFGVVFPGMDAELVVVIGGPAVANHYPGADANRATTAYAEWATPPRGMSRTNGYVATVASTRGVTVGAFSLSTQPVWSAEQGRYIPGLTFDLGPAGLVSARAFAYAVDADIAAPATIIANHAGTGNRIAIDLTFGSNMVRIRNLDNPALSIGPVDIATWVNSMTTSGVAWPSGPAGSVRALTADGLTWLPGRLLAYALGFDVAAGAGGAVDFVPR